MKERPAVRYSAASRALALLATTQADGSVTQTVPCVSLSWPLLTAPSSPTTSAHAAALRRRGPYQLRHTFATEALAAGISIFELARVMGTSVEMIDRTYGHLARDSDEAIRARLNARAGRDGDEVATGSE